MNAAKHILLGLACALILPACAVNQNSGQTNKMTVGTVQKSIHVGMGADEVAETLGSPNIVTTDDKRREVWIYDKINQEVSRSNSNLYGTLLLIGGSSQHSYNESSERTLTVIIKFDKNNKVRDFAYRTSRF